MHGELSEATASELASEGAAEVGPYVSLSTYSLPEYLVWSAWIEHWPFAVWVVEQARPRVIVELGTWTGFSYFSFCQAVEHSGVATHCFAVDTWQGDEQTGFYGHEVFEAVLARNQRYSWFSTLIRSTFDEASEKFDEGAIDLLHIDGLHTYEAVKHDFEHWLPKLSESAVVLFHDTNVHEREFGVSRLWTELTARYPHFEFTHGNGLGVLGTGARLPLQVRRLLDADPELAAEIRKVYSSLGRGVADHESTARLTRETTRLQEATESMRSGLESAQTDLHRANLDVAQLRTELSHSQGELSRVSGALSQAERKASEARRELSEARHEFSGAKDDLEARTLEAAALSDRLSVIEGSTTWRMTAGLRAFLARHRRIARAGRGTLRASYAMASIWPRTREKERSDSEAAAQETYGRWVDLYDTLDDADLRALTSSSAGLSYRPVVSVVMPAYETPARLLRDAIDSVIGQVYEHWELCIADDASTSREMQAILDEYAAKDPRVKVVRLGSRGGIAVASNAALELATGDYVALLDHDDVLRPHALYMVVSAINEQPEAVFLYSDEDKIDDRDVRFFPHFKPDWNPELFLSQNYLCHLSVFRRDCAMEVGGFRAGFDGSQDWDLFLRLTRGLDPATIVHIPHILYHWRAVEGSTAHAGDAKPYALVAGTRAVKGHLDAAGIKADVSTVGTAFERVRYCLPEQVPAVEVIVPSACKHPFVERLLKGVLHETDYANLHVSLVVSDALSADKSRSALLERVAESARLDVLTYPDRPFSFAWVNNFAVSQSTAEVICFLNDDLVVIHPDWLERMVGHVVQDRVGAVGAMLYYPDNTIQHGGVILGLGGVAGHYHHLLPRGSPGYRGRAWCNQDLSCVTAGCMVVRRQAFVDVGGFDEDFAVAFNDVDLCIRLRNHDWRIVWTPDAELYHLESTSIGKHDSSARSEQFAREVKLAVDRWEHTLLTDPYYNPNLSLAKQNELSFPPRRRYPWQLAEPRQTVAVG
jgi:GT2 family glycosyltransferase